MSKKVSITFEGKDTQDLIQKIINFLAITKYFNAGGKADDQGREAGDAESSSR